MIFDFIRERLFFVIALPLSLWLIAGTMTFKLRHPWATDTEILFYMKDALLFKRVSYNEMRKDYESQNH
jgi:hypothetical protein